MIYHAAVSAGDRKWRLPAEIRAVVITGYLVLAAVPVVLAVQLEPLNRLSVHRSSQ